MFWFKVGVKLNIKTKKRRKLEKNFDSGKDKNNVEVLLGFINFYFTLICIVIYQNFRRAPDLFINEDKVGPDQISSLSV